MVRELDFEVVAGEAQGVVQAVVVFGVVGVVCLVQIVQWIGVSIEVVVMVVLVEEDLVVVMGSVQEEE